MEIDDTDEEDHQNPKKISKLLDAIITKLIAFIGLIEESILVDQGLLLYFIGLQMELAIMCIDKSRALLAISYQEDVEYEILESLLNSHESLNIYRYSFKSYLTVQNVINLILLDKSYSRSLKYQLNRIRKDVFKLPKRNEDAAPTAVQKSILEACDLIESANAVSLAKVGENEFERTNLENLLAALSNKIHATSMSLTDTYFNHSDEQIQLVDQNYTR